MVTFWIDDLTVLLWPQVAADDDPGSEDDDSEQEQPRSQ
jgi:hypothetical protein